MRQTKLAQEIVKDLKNARKPRNKHDLLVSSGYSEITAKANPGDIIAQQGTQIALNVALEQAGFSTSSAKRVVGEILEKTYAEDKDRLKAAELIFKVEGAYAAEKSINATVDVNELLSQVAQDLKRFRGTE